MRQYDDETLGAYIDGELDGATATALEADLGSDAVLRGRLADLRAINAAVRQWSVGLVTQQETVWPSAPAPDRRGIRRRPTLFASRPLWSHALAACLALVFGVGIGQFVDISPRQHGGGSDEAVQRLLQAALEHSLSGQPVSWTDAAAHRSVTVEPIRTFRATDTFCREYRETMGGAKASERTMYGLACRDHGGTWNVEYTMAPGARSLLVSQ